MNKARIIAGAALIVLSCLALLVTCTDGYFKGKHIETKHNLINNLIKDKESIIKKADSTDLKLSIEDDKTKVAEVEQVHHYHTVYKTIYAASPDTCKPLLEQLSNEHERTDSIKNKRIDNLEKRIVEKTQKEDAFKDILVLKDYQLTLSHDTIVEQRTELKQKDKEVKKAKLKGWLRTIGASAAHLFIGYGAGKLIP